MDSPKTDAALIHLAIQEEGETIPVWDPKEFGRLWDLAFNETLEPEIHLTMVA